MFTVENQPVVAKDNTVIGERVWKSRFGIRWPAARSASDLQVYETDPATWAQWTNSGPTSPA